MDTKHLAALVLRKNGHGSNSFHRKQRGQQGDTLEKYRECRNIRDTSWKHAGRSGRPRKRSSKGPEARALMRSPRLETTSGMEETGPALMAAPPPGPGKEQGCTARQGPEQGGEQMTHFGNGQREQWMVSLRRRRLRGSQESRRADACQTGHDSHHQCDEAVPGGESSNLVIFQAHLFACLETFLNAPSLADRLDHLGKGCGRRREDKVVGFLGFVVEATANE